MNDQHEFVAIAKNIFDSNLYVSIKRPSKNTDLVV